MFKILGGVIVGIFLGTIITEIIRRQRPELVESIESKAKELTDKLFDGLKDNFDLRETDG